MTKIDHPKNVEEFYLEYKEFVYKWLRVKKYDTIKEEFFPIIEELIYQKKIEKSVRLLGIAISSLYMDEPEPKEEYSLQLRFDF